MLQLAIRRARQLSHCLPDTSHNTTHTLQRRIDRLVMLNLTKLLCERGMVAVNHNGIIL